MNEDMKVIADVKEKVLDLLHKANRAEEFSMGDVDFLCKAIKTVKDACEVEGMMDDGGWMAEGNYGRGSSYANRGQHYVRGHYGRNGGRDDMDGDYSSRRDRMGRYSRDDGRSEMMEYIEKAIKAADGEDKETLMRFMRQIENA